MIIRVVSVAGFAYVARADCHVGLVGLVVDLTAAPPVSALSPFFPFNEATCQAMIIDA